MCVYLFMCVFAGTCYIPLYFQAPHTMTGKTLAHDHLQKNEKTQTISNRSNTGLTNDITNCCIAF